ncbi:MAG TPA: hypothetical protein VFD33_07695, partial [Bacillota bacterium]|nr:hypothetical protein [Bacillota bacterium]
IKTYMGQHSGIPWFIYDKSYNILTAKEDNKEDLKLALVYMVLLIICVSSIMSIEYGSKPIDIVKACYHGRIRLLNTKLFIVLISALLLYLAVYIPQYININKFYDFDNLNAPLYSLVQFKYYNGGMSILHYLIMLNITKIIGAFVAVLIILTLSRRSMINTMLFSSIALLLPIVFSLVGLNFCEFIPTVALSCGNVALKNYSPIYGACALVIIGGLYIILANRVVKIGNLVKVHLKARSN